MAQKKYVRVRCRKSADRYNSSGYCFYDEANLESVTKGSDVLSIHCTYALSLNLAGCLSVEYGMQVVLLLLPYIESFVLLVGV